MERISVQHMQVLCVLAARPGELVTRADLIERVWDGNHPVGDRGIGNAIWGLRKLLGERRDAPRYLQTVPRKGYRLLEAVRPLETPRPAPPPGAAVAGRRPPRRLRLPHWSLVLGALLGLPILALWMQPDLALRAEYLRQRLAAGGGVVEFDAGGTRWVGIEAGQGPPLLLLHSFASSKEVWLPSMAALSARRHVLALDLPGWGESGRAPQGHYGYADQAERLGQLVAARWPGQRVDVVGHGMGAGIAAMWAARYAGQAGALVLVAPLGVPVENDLARGAAGGDRPFEVVDAYSLQRQLALVFDTVPHLPWPFEQALVERRRASLPFERQVYPQIALPEHGAWAPLAAARAVQRPVLLLRCANDRVVPARSLSAYLDALSQARAASLPRCNHMPMMEVPQAFTLATLDFLESVEAPVSAPSASIR
nr:alpha/beta fold hydrolase [Lysobacter sp. CAU 1642]